MKECIVCQNKFPGTKEYFCAHKKTSDGLEGRCKPCRKRYAQEYKKNFPVSYAERYLRSRNKPRTQYLQYHKNARAKNLQFELEESDFQNWHKMPCYYCGDIPDKVGVGRKNNLLGYVSENCVPCCSTCNFAKLTQSETQFLAHCEKITNYQYQKKLKKQLKLVVNQ